MSGIRTCQACGRENPADQDFCSCGEYLRWEPTSHLPAVTPQTSARAARPVSQGDGQHAAAGQHPAPGGVAAAPQHTAPAPGGPGAPAQAQPGHPGGPAHQQPAGAPGQAAPGQRPHRAARGSQHEPGQAPGAAPAQQPPPAGYRQQGGQPGHGQQGYQQPGGQPGHGQPDGQAGHGQRQQGGDPAYRRQQGAPGRRPRTGYTAPSLRSGDPLAGRSQAPLPAAHTGNAPAPPQAAAHMPAPPPGGPPATAEAHHPVPAPEPKKPGLVGLTLRVADVTGDQVERPDEKPIFAVEPQGRQALTLKIRNQSGIVDNYDIAVRGLPEEWYTIAPSTVYLVPFGSAGMYEQEVSIQFHPPKAPEAESRMWDLEVTAFSKAHSAEVGAAPAQMFIHPYEDYEAKIKPERQRTRRKAAYQVELVNKANAEATIWLSAVDPELALRYAFDKPYVKVPPGHTYHTELKVRPHKKLWIGRPNERRFDLSTDVAPVDEKPDAVERMEEASAKRPSGPKAMFKRGKQQAMQKAGVSGPRVNKGNIAIGQQGIRFQGPRVHKGSAAGRQLNLDNLRLPGFKRQAGAGGPNVPLLPTQAAFVQRPLIPWWIALIIPLIILIAIILWLLWPRDVTVPDVRSEQGVNAAQKRLKNDDLRLEKAEKKIVPERDVGKILDQAPDAGKKVKKDTGVVVTVGVASGKVEVPDLEGKSIADVSTELTEKQLSLGTIKPQDEDQEWVVKTQLPLAGTLANKGAPVNINVVEPPDPKKNANAKNPDKKDGPAPGPNEQQQDKDGKADIVVPPIDGKDDESYTGLVGDKKLIPSVVNIFDPAPTGRVVRTEPEPGTKLKEGAEVKVFVSAGIPELAYDNGNDVLRVNGSNGQGLPAIADNKDVFEDNPAWNSDGSLIAYRANNQILVQDPTKLDRPAGQVTKPNQKFDNPAFAPKPNSKLLAMTSDKGELCFGTVGRDAIDPGCAKSPDGFEVGKTISWAPDGKAILTIGLNAKDKTFGIVRYRSKKAFSPNATDWGKGEVVSPLNQKEFRGVSWVAYSPDGKTIAVISNLKGPQFRLYLTSADNTEMADVEPTNQTACEVAWRSDGRELALVGGDTGSCGLVRNAGGSPFGQIVTVAVKPPPEPKNGESSTYQPPTLDIRGGGRPLKPNARHATYLPKRLGKPAGEKRATSGSG